jgi:hypothetical protein
MKTIGKIGAGILSLVIGIAAPVYAQHEQHDQKGEKQGHSDQKEAKHEQAKPEQHGQQQRSEQHQQAQHVDQQQRHDQQQQHAQQAQHVQQSQRAQQHGQDQHAQQQRTQQQRQVQNNHRNQQARNAPEQHRIQQSTWQQHSSQRWDSDHRTWQQRGGYHGYRVPDDRFHGRFGSEHAFRIHGLPFMVYRGYPRFQYGGYWITAVDPWPEYWGNDWYDNDDVYVAYSNDGYYLYNRRYPTVGIAIRISM